MSFFLPVRPHRQGKKSERRPKPKESSSKQGGALQTAPLSFLFVVNEFQIFDGEDGPLCDRFGNPLPPNTSANYGIESPGIVWRYDNGAVSQADGYLWRRPQPGQPGNIAYTLQSLDEYGQQTWLDYNMGVHSTHSIFDCWRFLPCIYADADTSIIGDLEAEHRWMQLEFDHDSREPGMTRINGSERYVAGRNPSWIPSLLPETYALPQSQSSNSPQSKGLGGPLGIIIGLMALNRRPRHADHVFQQGWWRNNRWTGGPRSAHAEPDSKGPPRGVLVHICYDDYSNPHGSNFETLNDFEENGKAIIG
ncbi:hypothetical protein K456DRAFT_1161869 [Colletotrichum gloeosporioides 23]|nr:hypothetical protein K456DRAFT_1161869 [Colletotrichum gloeosporioides 23]